MSDDPTHPARPAHPGFVEAVREDARMTAAYRAERRDLRGPLDELREIIRLAVVSDAFLGQVLYRAKASLQAKGIPVLPRIAHRLAMMIAQVCIGDPVVVGPGLYLPHGQVVIDGIVEVGPHVTVRPWVTIGLKEGEFKGPTIGEGAQIGTGAKIIGPVEIGNGAKIGANAVVVDDVPAGHVAVGVPATVRTVRPKAAKQRSKR